MCFLSHNTGLDKDKGVPTSFRATLRRKLRNISLFFFKNTGVSMLEQKNILSAFYHLQDLAGPGAPVCVCVTDEHGFILGYTQMDGMGSRSFTMARAKAYTAARMGQSTAAFHSRLVQENLTLADFGDALMTSVRGGVPVCDGEGRILGGVAVSGRRPEEDEALALRLTKLLVP